MQCPHCESPDVMLCSVARAQGTTSTKMTGSSVMGTYTATGQTAFAERCAPPKSTLKYLLIATAIVVMLDLMALQDVFDRHVAPRGEIWFVPASLAVWALGVALYIANRPKRRARLERWHKSWICMRCGHLFVPGQ